jgi:hypothetical protein
MITYSPPPPLGALKDLRKQLAEVKLKCAVAEADRDASEYWKNYLEKTVVELRSSK